MTLREQKGRKLIKKGNVEKDQKKCYKKVTEKKRQNDTKSDEKGIKS